MATTLRIEQLESKVLVTGSHTVTLSVGGDYTLTIPETGTAALLGKAQTFSAAQLINYTTTDASSIALRSKADVTITADASRTTTALQVDGTIIIDSGKTNSGYFAAAYYAPFRASASDKGTLAALYGLLFNYGHTSAVDAAATTNNAYGLYIKGYYQQGTITNIYDIYIAAPATGGTTPTLSYALYIANTARSYFAGNVLVGTTTDLSSGTGIRVHGTLFHSNSAGALGFFGTTPITKVTALTAALTTISPPAYTPDTNVQAVTATSPYGFANANEGNTVINSVANLQTRVGEIETKLKAYGLFT